MIQRSRKTELIVLTPRLLKGDVTNEWDNITITKAESMVRNPTGIPDLPDRNTLPYLYSRTMRGK